MALRFTSTVFLLGTLLVLLPTGTWAFGAGDIPDFAYLNNKAFRHGDIENILESIVKSARGTVTAGGILGLAKSVIDKASGGTKFSKSDIKKVYFGNWLRDYSQAMDIAGLSKLSADTLVLIVSILGFMTFGFATNEFQVTADRLGVYLPVEHIDNPKGYAAKEGDARRFHEKLRPPVDDRELDVDQRTGMKNYIATEGRGWDTSTAFIRRTFISCIQHGRNSRGEDGPELYEAYRLLGTGLHTLEDLLAHSNWCEIALRKLGYKEVFCHVGEKVLVNSPQGPVPPLVTGTFGGADFIHSLMGEATDHLSQASVTDLSQKMDKASKEKDSKFEQLKAILGKFSVGGGDTVSSGEEMQEQSKAYRFNPDNIAPPEVQQQLFALLKWHDNIYREVVKKIEMVPGLTTLLDEWTNTLNAFVYTNLAPYMTPILQQATQALGEGSKSVITSADQTKVFDDPYASDPTHSFLSKDHFDLILNEPAGKIAQIVVVYAVNNIVQAWSNNNDPNRVIDVILEAFHHPYYASGHSRIQNDMFECMKGWIEEVDTQSIIQHLTKESVRNGKNKRPESESSSYCEPGYGSLGQGAHSITSGHQTQHLSGEARSSSYGQTAQAYPGRSKYQTDSTHGVSSGRYTDESGRRDSDYTEYESRTQNHSNFGRGAGSEHSYNDDGYGARQEERRDRREGHPGRSHNCDEKDQGRSSFSHSTGPRRTHDNDGYDVEPEGRHVNRQTRPGRNSDDYNEFRHGDSRYGQHCYGEKQGYGSRNQEYSGGNEDNGRSYSSAQGHNNPRGDAFTSSQTSSHGGHQPDRYQGYSGVNNNDSRSSESAQTYNRRGGQTGNYGGHQSSRHQDYSGGNDDNDHPSRTYGVSGYGERQSLYGSSRRDDCDYTNSQTNAHRSGEQEYSGRRREQGGRPDYDSYAPSYGQANRGESHFDGRQSDEHSQRYGHHAGGGHRSRHGDGSFEDENRGYAPSYDRSSSAYTSGEPDRGSRDSYDGSGKSGRENHSSRGRNDRTYGMERLNLDDEGESGY